MGKQEAEGEIEEFFRGKHGKEEVKKMRKLAMSYNIKLGKKRRLFCRKCFSMNLKVLGIKNMVKRVICTECCNVSRYGLE